MTLRQPLILPGNWSSPVAKQKSTARKRAQSGGSELDLTPVVPVRDAEILPAARAVCAHSPNAEAAILAMQQLGIYDRLRGVVPEHHAASTIAEMRNARHADGTSGASRASNQNTTRSSEETR